MPRGEQEQKIQKTYTNYGLAKWCHVIQFPPGTGRSWLLLKSAADMEESSSHR